MAFRRLPVEEGAWDDSHIQAMRDISDLASEEQNLRMDRDQRAFDKRLQSEEDSNREMIGNFQRGVENFASGRRQARKDSIEEQRLERQDAREDARAGREEADFELSKPEKQARADTATKRVGQEMEQADAAIASNKASARASTVQADVAEREEATMNAPAKYADAVQGETNRDYLARLEREGKKSQLELAKAQLQSEIAMQPLRKQEAQASIAASREATKGTRLANAATEKANRIAQLTAMASAPSQANIGQLPEALQGEYRAGRISPEEAGAVVANIKDAGMRAKVATNLANQSDPEFQARFAKSQKAQDDVQLYAGALAELETAAVQNKGNAIFNDQGAIDRMSDMARQLGMPESEIAEFADPSAWERVKNIGDGGFSSDTRAANLIARVKARMRAQIAAYPEAIKNDPKVRELAAKLDTPGGGGVVNIFGGGGRTQNAAQPAPGGINLGGQQLNLQGDARNGTLAPTGQPMQNGPQPLPGSRPRQRNVSK